MEQDSFFGDMSESEQENQLESQLKQTPPSYSQKKNPFSVKNPLQFDSFLAVNQNPSQPKINEFQLSPNQDKILPQPLLQSKQFQKKQQQAHFNPFGTIDMFSKPNSDLSIQIQQFNMSPPIQQEKIPYKPKNIIQKHLTPHLVEPLTPFQATGIQMPTLRPVEQPQIHQPHPPKQKFSGKQKVDIKKYKTQPCNLGYQCTNPFCMGYHYLGQKRRPQKEKFKAQLCPKLGICQKLDCQYAHTLTEYLCHQDIIMKYTCPLPTKEEETCARGFTCPHTHSESTKKNIDSKTLLKLIQMITQVQAEQESVKEIVEYYSKSRREVESCQNLVKCHGCRDGPKEFYRIPCGHCFCQACKNNSAVIKCSVCDARGIFLKIN